MLLALTLGGTVGRAAEDRQPPPSLSEKAGEAFGKLKPLLDAKDWPGILKLLDSIPNVVPGSYDEYSILDWKGNVYMQLDEYAKAVEAKEAVLKLGEAKGWIQPETALQITNMLARLLYVEAASLKEAKDKPRQQEMINKSLAYLKRFLQASKKPAADDMMFYAQLLYAQATSDAANIKMDMIREARETLERAMLTTITPKEGMYQLLAALLLTENDFARASELLELFVAKFPEKKDFWPQLMQCYVQLAINEKDETKARPLFVRAINTIERAQKLGVMNDPRTNYSLVTIYINAGQPGKATDILHAGLRKGTIESTTSNWRILGDQYRQADKPFQAIEALLEGAKAFPKDGMIEQQAGDIFLSLEKTKEARDHYRLATQKGGLEKPFVAWQLLAYTSMELEDWNTALMAITEAAKAPEFQKDPQSQRLKEHIESTVKRLKDEAEAKQKEATEKTKKSI